MYSPQQLIKHSDIFSKSVFELICTIIKRVIDPIWIKLYILFYIKKKSYEFTCKESFFSLYSFQKHKIWIFAS